jgi:hypothetical protein
MNADPRESVIEAAEAAGKRRFGDSVGFTGEEGEDSGELPVERPKDIHWADARGRGSPASP